MVAGEQVGVLVGQANIMPWISASSDGGMGLKLMTGCWCWRLLAPSASSGT